MITAMGATGNTGRPAVERLLSLGEPVRVLGRSAERLQPLVALGAEARVGNPTDPDFLTGAFQDSTVVSVIIPPDYTAPDVLAHYDRVAAATEQALRASGVRRIVLVSSLGAQHPDGTGPIAGLGRAERRFAALGIEVLALRPGYFFENFFGSLPLIRQLGVNGGAIAPNVALAMIAARDIGHAMADALRQRDWTGFRVRELLGPREYTMAEATAILGRAIGKPDLGYVQFPDADFEKGIVQAGFSPDAARLFTEMAHAVNDGLTRSVEGRNTRNTTPTTLESWAAGFAAAYRAG
jgi:uncharacterized protein YbjT (DUF2867 family)